MRTPFRTSNIDYVFEIMKGNEIVFYLQDASTDEIGFELSSTRTLNHVKNPVAVFRKIRELLLAYILDNKVNYFCFSGGTDRLKIYKSFANSLRKYGYEHTVHEGLFSFYRIC